MEQFCCRLVSIRCILVCFKLIPCNTNLKKKLYFLFLASLPLSQKALDKRVLEKEENPGKEEKEHLPEKVAGALTLREFQAEKFDSPLSVLADTPRNYAARMARQRKIKTGRSSLLLRPANSLDRCEAIVAECRIRFFRLTEKTFSV